MSQDTQPLSVRTTMKPPMVSKEKQEKTQLPDTGDTTGLSFSALGLATLGVAATFKRSKSHS